MSKNNWKISPFPELYEKENTMFLCKKQSSYVTKRLNLELILIHHLHDASVGFINSLKNKYNINQIIGIPYSSKKGVVSKLIETGNNVLIPQSLDKIPFIVEQIIKKTKNNIIIEEIGGYTSEIALELDSNPKVLGIVEDTNQGHWRWEKQKLWRLPVLSIANSDLKKIEDPYIGKSIIDGISNFLNITKKRDLSKRKIILLGYGRIGKQVATFIKPLVEKIIVYDKDPFKLTLAKIEGFKIPKIKINKLGEVLINENLFNYDTIIGTTGDPRHALRNEHISFLGKKLTLFSGSSKRVEFDIQNFKKNSNKIEENKHFSSYFINRKKIDVANNGEPINLKYSNVPSNILDLIYSGLVHCINKISTGHNEPGLKEICKTDQRRLIYEFLKLRRD